MLRLLHSLQVVSMEIVRASGQSVGIPTGFIQVHCCSQRGRLTSSWEKTKGNLLVVIGKQHMRTTQTNLLYDQ